MKRYLFVLGLLIVGVLTVVILGTSRTKAPLEGTLTACPTSEPLHGLLPILFRIGVLKKPPMASEMRASDTSSSVVIRPDPRDQIQCGKMPVKEFEGVVYAQPTLSGGRTKDLKMDILVPEPLRKRPVVVYIPGGGFVLAAKESSVDLRTYVAEAGFVVASIEYRTTRDSATFRDGIADVKSAVRYLRANAERYGIDAGEVSVWGESAGGYLAAMVGVTNGDKSFERGNNLDQRSDVQRVVDKFGASDISKIADDFDAPTQSANYSSDNLVLYIGKAKDGQVLDAAIASTTANPLTYIASSAPPFLLFHGSQDRLISPSQTLILHNALLAAGARSTRYVVDGAGHGDLAFMGDRISGLPWSTNRIMDLIVDFLRGPGAAPRPPASSVTPMLQTNAKR
jgi:acetyl esterase/lipase